MSFENRPNGRPDLRDAHRHGNRAENYDARARCDRATARRTGRAAIIAVALSVAASPPVAADFKVCNDTASRIGVAIGYTQPTTGQQAAEGWWTIASQTCETLLRGKLPSRRMYVHAIDYDQGGSWVGETRLCTRKEAFTAVGMRDCAQNGYQPEGFIEIDTGGSNQWTVRLSPSNRQGEGGS